MFSKPQLRSSLKYRVFIALKVYLGYNWDTVVELYVLIAQHSELNWLQYKWRIFSIYPLSRIFTTNPLPDYCKHNTLRGLVTIMMKNNYIAVLDSIFIYSSALGSVVWGTVFMVLYRPINPTPTGRNW